MTSKRQLILNDIETILTATAGIDSQIHRGSPNPAGIDKMPCMFLRFQRDLPNYDNLNFMNWKLQFEIDIVVNGADVEDLLDPIIVSAHNLLMADRSLGGKVLDILPGPQKLDIIKGNKETGVLNCIYLIDHRTDQNTLD